MVQLLCYRIQDSQIIRKEIEMSHHVLVVEDEIVTRTKLVGYFENEGYKVSQAESGTQMP